MSDTKNTFASLGIKDSILRIITNLGFEEPTPIQLQAIPPALKGQDIVGVAQTGTGKTLAFGIPMLERLALLKGRGLVVVPTRELAAQVAESIKSIGSPFGLRTAVLIGGEVIQKQIYILKRNPHIIIATPGRLIDHLKRRTLTLDQVKVIVLDEADMMFDLGFAPQIEEILKMAPKERQTMLFSATMPPAISKLAAKHLKLPISIEVAPQGSTAKTIQQEIIIIRPTERFSCLESLIRKNKGSILVFVRTKHGVKTVAKKLIDLSFSAAEIHSDLSQSRRHSTLEDFKKGKVRILIATDVAARGLDIKGIELVVNYNLPDAHTDYVHRIGRTGRAGVSGKAISFATQDQLREVAAIERLIDKKIPMRRNDNSPLVERQSQGQVEKKPFGETKKVKGINYSRQRGAKDYRGRSKSSDNKTEKSRPARFSQEKGSVHGGAKKTYGRKFRNNRFVGNK